MKSESSLTSSLWLVKSGDRIIGPYSTDELLDKIRSKEVAVIDEISAPCARWDYVRNQSAFATAVEEIRAGLASSREDTEIQGHTQTEIQTITDHGVPSRDGKLESSVPAPPPVTVRAFPDTIRTPPRPTLPPPPAASKRPSFLVIGAVIVMIISVCGGIYTSKNRIFPLATEEHPQDFSRVVAQGARAWEMGLFGEALVDYRRADQMQPGRPDIAARLAVLSMRIEGRTLEAKRMLDTASAHAIEVEDRRGIDLALGLAALASEDTAEAEARFHAAQEAGSWIGAFNLGSVALLKHAPIIAAGKFHEAGTQSVALLLLAHSLILANSGSGVPKEAEQGLETVVNRHADYQQEALIEEAVIAMDLGNRKKAALLTKAAFDTDPDATSDHFHDPFLVPDPLAANQLVQECKQLDAFLKSTVSHGLLAVFLTKAGSHVDAESLLLDQLAHSPEESSLQSAYAYVLIASGREDAARAALKLAHKNEPRLGLILEARMCAKMELPCAEENWAKLASDSAPPLAALTGLAEIRMKRGDANSAGALLVKAQNISATYLPLIRLRQATTGKM